MKYGAEKIMDVSTNFIWIIILFDEDFKCGYCLQFLGYVGVNAEKLCAEMFNFVQFVSY
jgi:hypothetical protein